jgi:general stress protein YciG
MTDANTNTATAPTKTEEKGKMTAAEMGRKGGNTTKERHGHDFYVQIGKKGGERAKKVYEAGKKVLEEAGE